MKKTIKCYLATFLVALVSYSTQAQSIVLNEVLASNAQNLKDEDGDTPDWIELYNAGIEEIDLAGYQITDDLSNPVPWTFPSYVMSPGQHLIVFASNKNKNEAPLSWVTVIDEGDEWSYLVPTSEPDGAWRSLGFDDSNWGLGNSGFGYGDGDDNTDVGSPTTSIFIRKTFDVSNAIDIEELMLHIDYDDGFIAYINGVEIARNGTVGEYPAFDSFADIIHEAVIFEERIPESFAVENPQDIIIEGQNVLAVQVHNANATSSDMSLIPILSLGSTKNLQGDVTEYLTLSQKSFHTDFKIASGGDTLMLFDSNQVMLDSVFTGSLIRDVSYGRSSDGAADWAYFDQPTPNASNDTPAYIAFSEGVDFSIPGGLYGEPQSIEMSSISGDAAIYYTLDGSIPTIQSNVYSSAISINSSGVLRARIIEDGALSGPITSASYLINVDHDIAVVSISADPFDFFDETEGMYMRGPNASNDFPYFGANFWEDWERPVYVEMFEPDGSLGFAANAGAKIFGGYSRGNDQKSLSLFFRKSYGDGPIDYRLFEEKKLDEYSSLVLRNSGNDYNNTQMRDGLMTSFFHESVDTQGYRPAVLYINGEYFGIQNIREKINEHFIANNNDIDSDSVQILEGAGYSVIGNEENYHSLIGYVQNMDLSIEANYEYVQSQMDIENYIYYMSGNIFINNTDWPGNNIKFWREDSETGKWRWIAYDKDFGFGIWDANDFVNNTLSFALQANGPDWPNPPWSTLLFRSLMENEDFKNDFINTYADQLNTSWTTEKLNEAITKKSDAIRSEIQSHLDRWYGNYGYWLSQIDVYYGYAENRPNYAKQHIIDALDLPGSFELSVETSGLGHGTVVLNSLELGDFPWSGTYFDQIPVELKAIPNEGYVFKEWVGVNANGDQVNLTTSSNTTVRAIFERVENKDVDIIVNEINYNSSEESGIDDWVELYNNSTNPVDLSNWVLKDSDDDHEYILPEGTVISSNGYFVISRGSSDFMSLYPTVENVVGDMEFGLSSQEDCVRLFDTFGAMISGVCYQNVAPWPDGVNGTGATLALKDPNFNMSVPENWFAQRVGSPGEKNVEEVTSVNNDFNSADLSNYPNPFTHTTTFEYKVSTEGQIALLVFDLQGRLVDELINEPKPIGNYQITWSPNQILRKGMYLVQLKTDKGRMQMRRVVLK